MELEQGLAWVDQAVRAHRGKPLSSLEIAVIRGACQGQTYEEIAIATAYSASYLSRSKIMGLVRFITADPVGTILARLI